MTQITSLKINGIKSYTQETEINLSQLNVYVGANSVGKSTAIQSLLLLRQLIDSYEKNQSAICEAYLNTEQYGLELGSYNSILTGDNEYFEIVCNGATTKIESVEGDTLKIKTDLTDLVAKEELNILNKNFYYLSAERIGPRTYQKIDSLGIETCGIHGENSLHILDKFSEKKILDELLHSEGKLQVQVSHPDKPVSACCN
jgi:predicted ATPase